MMSEKFFERLRERASEYGAPIFESAYEASAFGHGVHNALEALKEMMVGEPIEAIVEHEINQDTESSRTEEWTTIDSHPLYLDRYAECGFRGHHGTDGEEVTVMVFRDD